MCLRKELKGRKNPQRSKTKMELRRKYWKKYYKQRWDLPCSTSSVSGLSFLSSCLSCGVPSQVENLCVSLYSKLKNWRFLNLEYLNKLGMHLWVSPCVRVYIYGCVLYIYKCMYVYWIFTQIFLHVYLYIGQFVSHVHK